MFEQPPLTEIESIILQSAFAFSNLWRPLTRWHKPGMDDKNNQMPTVKTP